MIEAVFYGAYILFVVVVYLFLSAVIIYRGGQAERWQTFSLDFLLGFILVTYLLFGHVPIASRVFEGLKDLVRSSPLPGVGL